MYYVVEENSDNLRYPFPMYKGQTFNLYYSYDGNTSVKVLSVTDTLKIGGKTVKNVIKMQVTDSYGNSYVSYLAPGYGPFTFN